ncbi:MAG: hypothetical protein ACPG4T_03300 [Nannocystaceae bacterium]
MPTNDLAPVVIVGGVLWIAGRAYSKSKGGMGLGIGAGGGFLGMSVMDFLFGTPGDTDGEGTGGTVDGGADKQNGPLEDDVDGTGGGGKDKNEGDGKDSQNGASNQDGKGNDANGNDAKGDNDGGTGGGGGVGGGSGGGVGSDHGQGTGGGTQNQGGDKGEDEGGGDDEGEYDYDPFEGQYITEDLPPLNLNDTLLEDIRETVRLLVGGGIIDPGKDPEDAARLPPELHNFDVEAGGLLRFWADVAIHYHFDMPWGVLDKERPTHVPYIHLWNDILAFTAKYEWELNGDGSELGDVPTLFATTTKTPPAVEENPGRSIPRRGMGDPRNGSLFRTREVYINPFTRSAGWRQQA